MSHAKPLSLFRYLNPYRWQIAGATLAIVFTSAAVLGLGAALRFLVDEGISKGNEALLNWSFALLLSVTFLLAIATYARYYLVSWVGERVVADIRSDIYRHLLAMDMPYFERTRTGDLLSRLTTDTSILQTVVGSSVSVAIRNALLFFGGIVLLLLTSAQLTGYVAAIIPFVIVPIVMLGKKVRALGRESQAKIGQMNAYAEESIAAMRTIQMLTLEPHEDAQFSNCVEEAFGAALARIRQRAMLTGLVISLVFGAVVTVLWFGGKDVLAGHISAGDLSAFVFYSVVVAGAVGAISEVITDLQRAAGAADRIGELLQLTPKIISPSTLVEPLSSGVERVSFDAVSFTYPTRPEQPAIHDFSLVVEPGQTIALVGPSGAGKTTIFHLLLRLYDPDSGTIRLGDRDIRDIPLAMLRSLIGIVPQDPVIFSNTARENIRLGKLDADDEAILKAAETASALDFLQALPYGLDTYLGEKGVQISGGQRQRIAIARAVLRNPRMMLLDEATSALDSENEHQIQAALERVRMGRTTFVIAHRLSTIVNAHRIILMNEGRIERIGTHQELLVSSPLYARLAALQFKAIS